MFNTLMTIGALFAFAALVGVALVSIFDIRKLWLDNIIAGIGMLGGAIAACTLIGLALGFISF